MSKERYKVATTSKTPETAFHAVVTVYAPGKTFKDWKSVAAKDENLLSLIARRELKWEAGASFVYDAAGGQRRAIALSSGMLDAFKRLGLARELVASLKDAKAQSIRLDLTNLAAKDAESFLDAFTAALKAAEFQPNHYGKTPEGKAFAPAFEALVKGDAEGFREALRTSLAEAEGTNLVRELAMLAGNDLTPRNYADRLKKEAGREGLAYEFLDVKKLQKLKAGAFLAVAQASPEQDAGIVKLAYKPKKGGKHLVLVGKGVTFDTGGTNLKSAQYMYSMHKDMAGSAIAFALIRMAAREKWPFAVTAYLAISDNLTGPKAYRPNDVVTAMSGRTIEIVHTDAEGRMLFADTLHLASQDEPDLIVDFATLTGACIGAIGTNYAGAFTNRLDYHAAIIQSGRSSGERVWPFPLDDDYGECLKSDIADTKQCRLTGGVDHIEAAIFLKSFLAKDLPWIHVDLSAADHAGGLAHVATETTGFGVRFASHLLKTLWHFS